MKKRNFLSAITAVTLCFAILFSSCGASNTAKGGMAGGGAGAALGAGIGALIGGGKGAAWGAGIGAVVGGTAGSVIGNKMDKQRAELEKINGAQVESINDGQAIKVTFESGILFATNSSTLSQVSKNSLTQFAQSLNAHPDTDVQVYGHTDSTGSDRINDPLSERRAQSVYNFLSTQGVIGKRMIYQGFGSREPVATNATNDGRKQNRRVEIFILPNEKMLKDAELGR